MTWPDGSSGPKELRFCSQCGAEVDAGMEDCFCQGGRYATTRVPVIPLAQHEAEVERAKEGEGALPGSVAQHSIITPECRAGRGNQGAWDEAVARAKAEYDAILSGWGSAPVELHLALTFVRPETEAEESAREQTALDVSYGKYTGTEALLGELADELEELANEAQRTAGVPEESAAYRDAAALLRKHWNND